MKVSDSVLQEWIVMRQQFMEYYSTTGLVGCDGMGIHMTNINFLDTFTEYKTSNLGGGKFPIQHETTLNGVKFFCLKETL